MNDLEQTKDVVEPVEEVSVKEPTDKVSPEPEVVSGEPETPTLSEEDVTKRIEDAKVVWGEESERDWQSRKDKEIQPLKDKILELEQQSRLSTISAQDQSLTEQYGDTEEVRDFRALRDEQYDREVRLQEAEAKYGGKGGIIHKAIAYEMSTKYDVPMEELLKADNPDDIEPKARRLREEKREAKIKELEEQVSSKQPQVIDSSTKTVQGVDTESMTADDLLQRGFKQLKTK